jgi:hypothetical protein
MSQYHLNAIAAAQAGDWERTHEIVMQHADVLSCWIHALVHKVDGDVGNSRYWYARTSHVYEDFVDVVEELAAIKKMAGKI